MNGRGLITARLRSSGAKASRQREVRRKIGSRNDFKGCGHVSSVTHKGSCDPDSHLYLNGKKVNTSRMKASLRAGRVGLGRMQPLTDQFVWNLTKGLVFFEWAFGVPLRRPVLESDLSAKSRKLSKPGRLFLF